MQKPPPDTASGSLPASDHGSPPGGLGPALCGDIDMRIAPDGTWYYGASPIGRKELVALFASVLVRREDGFWLVTPAEQVRIQVDDAPFSAVELRRDGSDFTIRTNLDDCVTIDGDHPLRTGDTPEGDRAPYVAVRDGLEARFTRAAYYDLVEHATVETVDGEEWLGIRSGGLFFPLGPADGGDAP